MYNNFNSFITYILKTFRENLKLLYNYYIIIQFMNFQKIYVDIFLNITYIPIPWNLFIKFEPITVRLKVV